MSHDDGSYPDQPNHPGQPASFDRIRMEAEFFFRLREALGKIASESDDNIYVLLSDGDKLREFVRNKGLRRHGFCS